MSLKREDLNKVFDRSFENPKDPRKSSKNDLKANRSREKLIEVHYRIRWISFELFEERITHWYSEIESLACFALTISNGKFSITAESRFVKPYRNIIPYQAIEDNDYHYNINILNKQPKQKELLNG